MSDPLISSKDDENPIRHGEVQQAGVVGYTAAFLASLAMMLAGLLVIEFHAMPSRYLVGTIAGFAFIALLAQAFLSFGLDISYHNIWKSVSLVLTIPLFILTIGLSVWMFQQLANNVMVPGANILPGHTMQPTMLQ